ncbi:IDEAL domain-containing protein [Cohnella sp. WQ 127256]|uniref:IDEAL domain-containing protein n=1 Tax=Cohnella sp. WQ 127256 TaxID=2938790 RepID=UPI0021177927|nr:IDEAL domain-containing protein [Cohnella sp. WQ 127256]
MKVEMSEWVMAKTKNGELIQGFVDAIDDQQGVATVFVVKSDNVESVGKSVVVRDRWLRKLPTYSLDDAEAIQSLIDLALATRDEQWFTELSQTLSKVTASGNKDRVKSSVTSSSFTHRLGYPVGDR